MHGLWIVYHPQGLTFGREEHKTRLIPQVEQLASNISPVPATVVKAGDLIPSSRKRIFGISEDR
jgi:hypothetical protein